MKYRGVIWGLGLALVLVAPTKAQDDKKGAAAKVDQAKIDEAVKKAIEFLKVTEPPATKGFQHAEHPFQKTEIVLWAYLRGGMKPSEPQFVALFKDMMERRLETTYAVAFQALILEELDRAKYQWRLHQCAQFLVDSQTSLGGWGYGEPSPAADAIPAGDKTLDPSGPARPKPKVAKKLTVRRTKEGERPDNSNSGWAALGLRACSDAGIVIPPEVIVSGEKQWRRTHKGPGDGWCYSDHSDHKAYGSMTASGVASLAILSQLRGAKKSWKSDPQEVAGLQWLTKNVSVTSHPGDFEQGRPGDPNRQYFYWMATFERAMDLTGTQTLGKHDWYAEGVDALLKVQEPTGSWNRTIHDTCLAVLFLVRATVPLESETKK